MIGKCNTSCDWPCNFGFCSDQVEKREKGKRKKGSDNEQSEEEDGEDDDEIETSQSQRKSTKT